MECAKCGFQNQEEARFCNQCGGKMELGCSECGRVNPPGSKFCNACGAGLIQPPTQLPIEEEIHALEGTVNEFRGDDLRMDYTVLGDTANLAARLETLAAPGSILLSGNTFRLIRDYFE